MREQGDSTFKFYYFVGNYRNMYLSSKVIGNFSSPVTAGNNAISSTPFYYRVDGMAGIGRSSIKHRLERITNDMRMNQSMKRRKC
jgi:hypothetical protein